jgi:hypothetical protein
MLCREHLPTCYFCERSEQLGKIDQRSGRLRLLLQARSKTSVQTFYAGTGYSLLNANKAAGMVNR